MTCEAKLAEIEKIIESDWTNAWKVCEIMKVLEHGTY